MRKAFNTSILHSADTLELVLLPFYMTGWVLHVGTMPASSSSSDTVASHAESNSRDAQHSTRPQPAVGTRRYNAAHCTDNRPPRYYACFSWSLDLLQTNAGLL